MKLRVSEAEKHPEIPYAFHFAVSAGALDVQLVSAELVGELFFDGTLSYTGRSFRLEGQVKLQKRFVCDRCLAECTRECTYPFSEEFCRKDTHGANHADVRWFDGDSLELDEVFREIVILSQPLHHLCSPDCRGLCPKCGADLNRGECGCDRTSIDPRLAVLQKLLNEK